jgi:PAS domain S-box-containing protein
VYVIATYRRLKVTAHFRSFAPSSFSIDRQIERYVCPHAIAYPCRGTLGLKLGGRRQFRKRSKGSVKHGIAVTKSKQTEQALQKSGQWYRLMFDNMTNAVAVYKAIDRGNDFIITDFNSAAEMVEKVKRENVIGKSVLKVFPGVEDFGLFAVFQQVWRTGRPQHHPALLYKDRRASGWRENYVYKLPSGEIVAIYQDVTERKRIEEELRKNEARYRSLLEGSHEAITINTPNGTYVDVNQAWLDLFGYTREEMLGLKAEQLYVNPADRTRFRQKIENEGFVKDYPVKLLRKDGKTLDCLFTSSVWRDNDGRIIGYQGIIRDITEHNQMESELRKSEERFRTIFQYIPIPTVILSFEEGSYPQSMIIDVNDEWTRTMGFSRNEAIGHSTTELGILLNSKQRDQLSKELSEKGRVSGVEIERRTKSGEICNFFSTVELVELGGKKYALNMWVDITERKKMEEQLKRHSSRLEEMVEERAGKLKRSEERLRRIYDTTLNVLYTTSLEGEILDMNPAGLSLFGFQNLDEARKTNIKTLYANLDDRRKLIELAEQGPIINFETKFKKTDDQTIEALVNTYPLRDEEKKLIGFQEAIIDITERKEVEKMRDQLTQALVQDVERRKELERMRDQFISAVTHELRTPLVSMTGYLDLALSEESQPMSEEVLSDLHVVKRNMDRLLNLVNDLLDISRMQSGRFQLNLQPIDLKDVMNTYIKDTQPLLEEKKQNLKLEIPENELPVQADQVRLCQAVMNLLSNATKFSSEGSEITLRIEEEQEEITVKVSDKGIGIKKEDLERVFEPFSAIEKPTYIKGTGLGLSITRGLVEAHGGRIWAESEGEGKGTTFTFTLPKQK